MGTVWMAQQTEPVKRLVALKLIKPGMDSKQVIARFEAERQALALMDHPNIARVLDADATSTGRPYFVMDLVKGVPLTRYCDEHRLTPRERLELFLPVCQAIQHAHQKGIIHRDIKPSNVLVASYDGKPVPKVIDFGVAKATGQQLTEHSLVTGFGAVVGTLEYMSPEQAELNQLDIDTRSDIYSLGVLLYELLTGSTPLDKKRLHQTAMLEVLRIIREEEPPRPSTRLSTTEELPTVAANRGLEPRKLSGVVRGELDWIVMKALEKDRNRRYETANGFAMDVQRYLADEPVLACPPSAAYRLRKFVRRHQAGLLTTAALLLTTAALLLVVLLAGAGIGWMLWDRAAQQVARRATTKHSVSGALDRAAELSEQAQQMPCANSVEAAAVLVVWQKAQDAVARAETALTTGADDEVLRQRVVELRAQLDQGQARAVRKEQLFRDLDEARLAVYEVVDDRLDLNYAGCAARYAAAFAAFGLEVRPERSDELARRIAAEEPVVREALLVALLDWHRTSYRATKRPATVLLELLKAADSNPWRKQYLAAAIKRDGPALLNLSAEARRSSLPPSLLVHLAVTLWGNGEEDEGLALLRWGRGRYPSDFWLHHQLGHQLLESASRERPTAVELEEAIGCYRAALALRPEKVVVHSNLGNALRRKGQLDEAIAACREAIRLKQDYAEAHNHLGNALHDKGQLDEAVAEYRLAISLKKDYAAPHHNLGNVLRDKGQLDEAIAKYGMAISLKKDNALYHYNLGNALRAKGQLNKAIDAFNEAVRLKPDYPEAHTNLGLALHEAGRTEEAIAAYHKALRTNKSFREAYKAHTNLGNAFTMLGRWDDAIAAHRKAIPLLKEDFAKPRLADVYTSLGNALSYKGQLDEAIDVLREAIRLNKDNALAHCVLGNTLAKQGRLDEAIVALRHAINLKQNDAEFHFSLGRALRGNGQLDDAIAAYREAIRLKEDFAEAHCNLAQALEETWQFRDALKEWRRGHELGSKQPGWHYPSAHWVRRCERRIELEPKLPDILAGNVRPASPAERIEVAELCALKRLHRAAASFYEEALAEQPKLADDLTAAHRYEAACAAALAGCGKGQDAHHDGDTERARLRRQALDWLRADRQAWDRRIDREPDKVPKIVEQMHHWLTDTDFAGVRGAEALARLPEAEREPWQTLWSDIANTLARAQAKKPQKKSDPK
jgi:tetratricopeptide (TPR) repeat protein